MAVGAGPCGTTALLPGFVNARDAEGAQAMLDHIQMSSRTETKMSGMGISSRPFVLVYQRNRM